MTVFRQDARFIEADQGLGDLDQMDRVNDADPPARRDAGDRLRIEQVGIHFGLGIDEPGPDVRDDGLRILLVPRQEEGGSQIADDLAEAYHRVAMCYEIIRIGLPVPADVRAGRILRIGPPIIPFGEEIMQRSGAAGRGRGRHGHRLGAQILLRQREDSLFQRLGDTRAVLVLFHAGRRQKQGHQQQVFKSHICVIE